MTELKLKNIKPSITGESDKYSHNLWRWCSSFKKSYKHLPQVYFLGDKTAAFSSLEDVRLLPHQVYLGKVSTHSGDLIGNQLTNILNRELHKGQPSQWCYIPGEHFDPDHLTDITELFWEAYQEIGRCLIFDHSAFGIRGAAERFAYTDEKTKRTCQWCGKAEALHEVEVVTIKKQWMSVTPSTES